MAAASFPACLICGVTGSGKTSFIRMLNGGEPTLPKFSSDTDVTSHHILKNTQVMLIDTPGFLDSRVPQPGQKIVTREQLFNGMLKHISTNKLNVKKVFILMPGTERLNEEAASWCADLLCATQVPNAQLCVVLTKLDTKSQEMRSTELINQIKQVFEGATVIGVGENRLDAVLPTFQDLDKLPTLKLKSEFQSSESLSRLLAKLKQDKKEATLLHEQIKVQQTEEKEQTLNQLKAQYREWSDRLTEVSKQNCPDTSLMGDANQELMKLHESIILIQEGKLTVIQSKPAIAAILARIEEIETEFGKRNSFVILFERLRMVGKAAISGMESENPYIPMLHGIMAATEMKGKRA